MWHIRGRVEEPVDAVTAVAPDDGESVTLRVLLDDATDVAVLDARFD